MDAGTSALIDVAVEWLFANLPTQEHASLQIITEDAAGEKTMIKVYAGDDAEMLRNAETAVRRAGAIRYCALGEGQIVSREGAVTTVLILYTQEPRVARVQRFVRPYRRIGSEYGLGSEWYAQGELENTWL